MIQSRLLSFISSVAAVTLLATGASHAQEIMIWHDKGEDGLRMIEQMAELYKKDHPGVTVKSLSMPTEQWFSRSIAALNTNTAPDILFNDNTRIVSIQQSTGKLSDLKQEADQLPVADKSSLTEGDWTASTFKNRVVQIPFQRTMTGLGVRKSWLEKVGEQPPKTWDDVIRIGKKFRTKTQTGTAGKIHLGSPCRLATHLLLPAEASTSLFTGTACPIRL